MLVSYQTKPYHYRIRSDPAHPAPPDLATLHRKPSWHNRAGNVDRSACLEIRASELWRLIHPRKFQRTPSAAGRQASAAITIDSTFIFNLHQTRLPRTLIGDQRTPKSNAMKTARDGSPRRRHRKPHDQPWIALADSTDFHYPNPNKGAARTKMLGLWTGDEPGYINAGPWKQTIAVERWRRTSRAAQPRRRAGSHQRSHIPAHEHFLICPQCKTKRKKLFMILAHEQEVIDAEMAEGWINLIDAHPNWHRVCTADEALSAKRARLISRYGLLFRDRRLLCAACLGLRWGEVRKSRRHDTGERAAHRARRRERREDRAHDRRQVQVQAHVQALEDALALEKLPPQRHAICARELKERRRAEARQARADELRRQRREAQQRCELEQQRDIQRRRDQFEADYCTPETRANLRFIRERIPQLKRAAQDLPHYRKHIEAILTLMDLFIIAPEKSKSRK